MAWINISFAMLPLLLMYLFTPESPTWLVSRGRNEEALKACKIVSMDKAKVIIKVFLLFVIIFSFSQSFATDRHFANYSRDIVAFLFTSG